MRITKGLLWLGLGLAGSSAAPLSAQRSASVVGVYQSRVMEVGSRLALAPSGRFLWTFSTGALDLAAEGRWTRDSDGSVLLNSDPAVTPPRLELVGRRRDSLPGIAIRLACDTGQASQFLDTVLEYADGQRESRDFEGLALRTVDEPGRPLAAIYAGSLVFGFVSERVPIVAGGDNVFTFRFTANDLGRADFHDVRITIANRALSFDWRGMPLRYVRETTNGFDAHGDLPRLPPIPGSVTNAAPASLYVAIGEPFDGLVTRSGQSLTNIPGEQMLIARGPIDLELDYDGPSMNIGRVAGGSQALTITGDGERVNGIAFNDGPGLMALDEALTRAQALKHQLEGSGFGLLPGADRMGDLAAFTTIETNGDEAAHASDWADAAHMLADEPRGIAAMQLYTLRTRTHVASVRLENAGRREREECPHSEWSSEGGRDWRLAVRIMPSRPPETE